MAYPLSLSRRPARRAVVVLARRRCRARAEDTRGDCMGGDGGERSKKEGVSMQGSKGGWRLP